MLLAPAFGPRGSTAYSAATADPGWARTGALIGIIGGGLAVLLGAASTIASDDEDIATGLGIGATLAFGATVPIVAAGASSARDDPRVKGSSAWRIAGWIGYGITMLNAVALVGIGLADGEVYPAQTLGLVVLGGGSTAAMLVDAYASASDAEALGAAAPASASVAWTPVFGFTRNALGGKDGYVGMAARF